MARALYRKYRSKSLDEIVGQAHIVEVLKRAIAKDRLSHAYLLTGPRGVGKTSVARILAHEINRLPYTDDSTHLDIIEIDAASNNGVEDVRDLREKVRLAPISATKKIYIIDEVHMLSKAAFNALLKTLEEPPEHVIFILATTDADKLPATIISRTQQFGFRPIEPAIAVKHLKMIAKKEKITIDDAALQLLGEAGEGSFRDSIGLLDQLANLADEKSGITTELVEQVLGMAPHTLIAKLVTAHDEHDLNAIVNLVQKLSETGIDAVTASRQLITHLRHAITDTPQHIELLDELLHVPKSSLPSVKLLTVLARGAVPTIPPKPKSAPLIASPAVILSSPIPELEKLATKKHPKNPPVTKSIPAQPFDAKQLIEYTKKEFVAIYSVLSKCSFEISGDELTIYTVNAFYKKKLDDGKYRQKLESSLEAIGMPNLTINTVPTVCPPKDEQAAKVAAIMGGGEEVSLDNNG